MPRLASLIAVAILAIAAARARDHGDWRTDAPGMVHHLTPTDLPPDYVTRVQQGEFFGWPWYYIGAHEDPRHNGERPDLAARISIPEVLLQPHSAPLGMTFYHGAGVAAFPAEYQGDAFVALHGSWNRSKRTGYKVIRIHLNNGVPDGTYQDFVTGFAAGADSVWGRPVGVATAHDGALLFTEDGNGTLWRVAYTGAPS